MTYVDSGYFDSNFILRQSCFGTILTKTCCHSDGNLAQIICDCGQMWVDGPRFESDTKIAFFSNFATTFFELNGHALVEDNYI